MYKVHVSDRLLALHDGPFLEALKKLNRGTIHLPTRTKDCPDRTDWRCALRDLRQWLNDNQNVVQFRSTTENLLGKLPQMFPILTNTYFSGAGLMDIGLEAGG